MQCYQSSLHFSSKKQSRPRAERIPVGYTSRGGSSQSYLPYNYIIYIYIIRWNDDHLRIRTWGPKASIIILTPAPPPSPQKIDDQQPMDYIRCSARIKSFKGHFSAEFSYFRPTTTYLHHNFSIITIITVCSLTDHHSLEHFFPQFANVLVVKYV